MQVTDTNPMVGLDGRTALLVRLSAALASNPQFFGEDARPGNMLGESPSHVPTPLPLCSGTSDGIKRISTDFLETQSKLAGPTCHIPITALWSVLIDGLSPIWPSRHTLNGISLGDVWPCPALALAHPDRPEWASYVPFHKLSGWIAYSLVEPIQKLMGWTVEGIEDLTGLPEYRNGPPLRSRARVRR